MKVGVYIVSVIRPGSGGQFTYFEKLIHAIDRHSFDKQIEVCFVSRRPVKKMELQKPTVRIAPLLFYIPSWLLDKFGVLNFLSRILFTNVDVCSRIDLRALRKNKVDVILYPKQTYMEVKNFPFITMNWDIGHKSTYTFPELLYNGSFDTRERWYQRDMQKALAIFTESVAGKKELEKFLLIEPSKIAVVPIFPGNVAEMEVNESTGDRILKEFGLQKQRFFYYPAQFWAHKNHYNLILAFEKLLQRRPEDADLKLILTGSDKGNKNYILDLVKERQLTANVIVEDYVSVEAVCVLYKSSLALVMPTFMGPTNMPLLEAQSLGTPIITSDFEGHREQLGDGAIYIQPEKADSICEAMISVLDPNTRNQLVAKGFEVKKRSPFTVENAVVRIEEELVRLAPIRKAFR